MADLKKDLQALRRNIEFVLMDNPTLLKGYSLAKTFVPDLTLEDFAKAPSVPAIASQNGKLVTVLADKIYPVPDEVRKEITTNIKQLNDKSGTYFSLEYVLIDENDDVESVQLSYTLSDAAKFNAIKKAISSGEGIESIFFAPNTPPTDGNYTISRMVVGKRFNIIEITSKTGSFSFIANSEKCEGLAVKSALTTAAGTVKNAAGEVISGGGSDIFKAKFVKDQVFLVSSIERLEKENAEGQPVFVMEVAGVKYWAHGSILKEMIPLYITSGLFRVTTVEKVTKGIRVICKLIGVPGRPGYENALAKVKLTALQVASEEQAEAQPPEVEKETATPVCPMPSAASNDDESGDLEDAPAPTEELAAV